mmetsp:Transcript_123841/g.246394  ORF Transcript_123841/g.246394 Transcript_123841/m.246394 type:complete len:1760 (-) Transcript_123841:93-5372(-)
MAMSARRWASTGRDGAEAVKGSVREPSRDSLPRLPGVGDSTQQRGRSISQKRQPLVSSVELPAAPGRGTDRTRLRDGQHQPPQAPSPRGKQTRQPPETDAGTQPKAKRSASARAQPHPAVLVCLSTDAELECALAQAPPNNATSAAACGSSSPAQEGAQPAGDNTVVLLEVVGASAQDALALYSLECCVQPVEVPRQKVTKGRVAAKGNAKAAANSKSRERQGPAQKGSRSASAPAKGASAEEDVEVWRNIDAWAIEVTGGRSLIATRLPDPGIVACRLVHRSLSDWSKWSQLVRRDAQSWLSQLIEPVVLGVAAPSSVQCQLETRETERGGLQLVVLRWFVERVSEVLIAFTCLWQYRWRWAASDQWNDGPVFQNSKSSNSGDALGAYCSPALQGDWSLRDSGEIEFCIRYAHHRLIEWSPWSACSQPLTLGCGPPRCPRGTSNTAAIMVELLRGDPTRAELAWEPFSFANSVAPNSPLEYRIRLRVVEEDGRVHSTVGGGGTPGSVAISAAAAAEEERCWSHVGWLEAPAAAQATSSGHGDRLHQHWHSCPLSSLRPHTRHLAQVQARYRGGSGCATIGGWSEVLECAFSTRDSCIDSGSMPPPEVRTVRGSCGGYGSGPASVTTACSICLPPALALLPAAGLLMEWRPAVAATAVSGWRSTTWSLDDRGLAAVPQREKGSSVLVELEGVHEEVYLRCHHSTGGASSIVHVTPEFQAPSPPRMTIVAEDHQLRYEGELIPVQAPCRRPASRYQVRCECIGEEGNIIDFPPAVLGPTTRSIRFIVARGDVVPLATYTFLARVGDGRVWSAWSARSPPAAFLVAPPRNRDNTGLRVKSLGAGSACIELRWDPFILQTGLRAVDYHIDIAPPERPEDADELFVPGALALADGSCKTSVARLAPDTEYLFIVSASYPFLGHLSKREDGGTLMARFRTPPVDRVPFLPPAPPQQAKLDCKGTSAAVLSATSGTHAWMLLVLLDACLKGYGGDDSGYVVQWRMFGGTDGQPGTWVNFSAVDVLHAEKPKVGTMLAHCDLKAEVSGINGHLLPPEQVQLRLCMHSAAARVSAAQHFWYSEPSSPMTTAFGAVQAPPTSLQWEDGRLQVGVTLILGATCLEASAAVVPGEDGSNSPMAFRVPPSGFGHRFATRFQVRFHRATAPELDRPSETDQHDQHGCELEAGWLCDLSEMGNSNGAQGGAVASKVRLVLLSVERCPIKYGESYAFSARIGDAHTWSDWSSRGLPVKIAMPPLRCPGGVLQASTPENRKVTLEWDPLVCSFGRVPVECLVSMVNVPEELALEGLPAGQQVSLDCSDQLLLHLRVTAPPARLGQPEEPKPRAEVTILGFEPGQHYQFILRARHDVLGVAETIFTEVARSATFRWQPRLDEEWSAAIDWSIPVPVQQGLPEDLEESSTRWQGNAVLLAWPEGMPAEEGCSLELQAREELEAHAVLGWKPVEHSARVKLAGIDYVAAYDLPFQIGRFRWRDPGRPAALSPASEVCLAQIPAAPRPTADVFCTRCALRVRVYAPLTRQQAQLSASFRVRYRSPATITEPPTPWRVLVGRSHGRDGQAGVNSIGNTLADTHLGEDDGLTLGGMYVFCMQLSADCGRRSQWSEESAPVQFDAPVAFGEAPAGAQLVVQAATLTSVTFTWPKLVPPAVVSQPGSRRTARPALECRIDVCRCLADSTVELQTSALVEEDDKDGRGAPTEASVFNLLPATEYMAELSVRFQRLGTRRWQSTGLTSSFVTPAEQEAPKSRRVR